MVIGSEVNNVTVNGSAATNIQYSSPQQSADIINFGPGTIFVSWRRTAIVGDVNCLVLPVGTSYEIRSSSAWNVLSLISDVETSAQVVMR
jgi:hypothetical protein